MKWKKINNRPVIALFALLSALGWSMAEAGTRSGHSRGDYSNLRRNG